MVRPYNHVVDGFKTCPECGVSKPTTDFHLDKRKNKPRARCKPCVSELTRAAYHNNTNGVKDKRTAYNAANKPRLAAWQRAKKEDPGWVEKAAQRDAEYKRRTRDQRLPRRREAILNDRMKVLRHYSGGEPKCACCGVTEYVFLSIDHIYNDGAAHRKEIGGSQCLVRWILKNDFPPRFQILCHNCNRAKELLGTCPHQKDKQNGS